MTFLYIKQLPEITSCLWKCEDTRIMKDKLFEVYGGLVFMSRHGAVILNRANPSSTRHSTSAYQRHRRTPCPGIGPVGGPWSNRWSWHLTTVIGDSDDFTSKTCIYHGSLYHHISSMVINGGFSIYKWWSMEDFPATFDCQRVTCTESMRPPNTY